MKRIFLAISVALLTVSCSEEKSSSSQPEKHPLHGKTYFFNFVGPHNEVMIDSYSFDSTGKVTYLRQMKPIDKTNVMEIRKFTGTYAVNGDTIDIVYSYRTCASDKDRETFTFVDATFGRMALTRSDAPEVTIIYKDDAKHGIEGFSMAQIEVIKEDKDCKNGYLSKAQAEPKRLPASKRRGL